MFPYTWHTMDRLARQACHPAIFSFRDQRIIVLRVLFTLAYERRRCEHATDARKYLDQLSKILLEWSTFLPKWAGRGELCTEETCLALARVIKDSTDEVTSDIRGLSFFARKVFEMIHFQVLGLTPGCFPLDLDFGDYTSVVEHQTPTCSARAEPGSDEDSLLLNKAWNWIHTTRRDCMCLECVPRDRRTPVPLFGLAERTGRADSRIVSNESSIRIHCQDRRSVKPILSKVLGKLSIKIALKTVHRK